MRQNLGARITTSATMTPQLIQSIRFLQLSAQELEQEIADVLDRNLMLESDDMAADDGDSESFDSIHVLGSSAGDEIPEDRDPSDADRDLRARLLDQLQVALSDSVDLAIALTLLDALDETGYLEDRPIDIARGLTQAGLDVDLARVEQVRAVFMRQDPAGVGALDLRECLLAQLSQSAEPAASLATRLVAGHLEALAHAELDELCERLAVDMSTLRDAIDTIRRLNPKPGLDAQASEITVPDAIVSVTDRGVVVRLNGAAHPHLRLNTTYERMLGQCNRADAAALNDQLVEARWFLRSIEMRRDTILRTVQAIFERQPDYLEKGEAGLRPMTLKQIADDIGMHESTICRVTTSKYIQTPRGVIELKRFFSSEVGSGTQTSASGTAVKAMIRNIIAAEPRDEPYCDADITAILARRGVTVARRTVAKYREAMGIHSAKLRAQRITTLDEALA